MYPSWFAVSCCSRLPRLTCCFSLVCVSALSMMLQVVSDYLTPYDGEQRYLAAMNKPVTTYTYKMAFRRHHEAGHTAAALTTS